MVRHLTVVRAAGSVSNVDTASHRFRLIPSFGKGTIRRFPTNVSDVRQNVARHFEDVLQVSRAVFTDSNTDLLLSKQCAIPAFEGLFPKEHDDVIQLLLFRLAEWHALAKLRLHTDDSLNKLDEALNALGKQLRRFQQFTCSSFETMELPREVAARQRRQDANFQSTSQQARASGAHLRTFNILTYKLHVLGDYAASIRLFGTTDSYTTQIVRVSCSATLTIFILTLCILQGELAHRLIKMLYRSTNKQDTSKQLAKQEQRHTCVRRQQSSESTSLAHNICTGDLPPEAHHFLSGNRSNIINLASYLSGHRNDPAIEVRPNKLLMFSLLTIPKELYSKTERSPSLTTARLGL